MNDPFTYTIYRASYYRLPTISRTSSGAILVLVETVLGFRNVPSSSHPYYVTLDFDGTLDKDFNLGSTPVGAR